MNVQVFPIQQDSITPDLYIVDVTHVKKGLRWIKLEPVQTAAISISSKRSVHLERIDDPRLELFL